MNRFLTALAAACFSLAAASALAHAPASDTDRQVKHERIKQAREACKDKPDQRGCMTEQYCAKSQDPAQCHVQARERYATMSLRMDQRQAAHEACTGKRGDELQKCLHSQRGMSGHGGHGSPDKK